MSSSNPIAPSVQHALSRINREGGDGNRFVCQGDRGYVVVSGERGSSTIKVQAAAGRALESPLDQHDAQQLYERGFRRSSAAAPFERVYKGSVPHENVELIEIITLIMQRLYLSQSGTMTIKFTLGDLIELNNTKLHSAIQKLINDKDMRLRQKFYWSFVKAEFLLALDQPAPDLNPLLSGADQAKILGTQLSYHIFKEITPYRSAGVFSEMNTMLNYDPRGLDFIKISGRTVAALMVSDKIDSLLINPRGQIGGELYRNELDSIDEAMRRFNR